MSDIITEAFEVHDELNPKLWNNDTMTLLPDVEDAIFDIVEEFRDNVLDMTGIEINPVDIQLLGSNASYNYTKYSDLDVHIILNFELLDASEDLVQALFNLQKSEFNSKYDITIKGIEVEIYVEDVKASAVSNGIYSLMNNEWVKKPNPIKDVPEVNIEKDIDEWKDKINNVLNREDIDEISKTIDDLYLMRKNGLQSEGEYGAKNQIFKEVRNLGLLQDLKDAYMELRSKELSLEKLDRTKSEKIDRDKYKTTYAGSLRISRGLESNKDYWIDYLENTFDYTPRTSWSNIFDNIIKDFEEYIFTNRSAGHYEGGWFDSFADAYDKDDSEAQVDREFKYFIDEMDYYNLPEFLDRVY